MREPKNTRCSFAFSVSEPPRIILKMLTEWTLKVRSVSDVSVASICVICDSATWVLLRWLPSLPETHCPLWTCSSIGTVVTVLPVLLQRPNPRPRTGYDNRYSTVVVATRVVGPGPAAWAGGAASHVGPGLMSRCCVATVRARTGSLFCSVTTLVRNR